MPGDVPVKGLSPEQRQELERLLELARTGDHYRLLGVPEDAEQKEIQEAFYALSRRWHPDRFFRMDIGDDAERLEEVFIAIAEAWRVLGDEARRAVYDMERGKRARRRGASDSAVQPPDPEGASVHEVRIERGRARAGGAGTGGAGRAARRRRRPRTPGLAALQKQLVERLRRARRYYLEGKKEYEAGDVIKASSTLALAVSYDPRNEEYRRFHEQALREARRIQAEQLMQAAESAEAYRSFRDAIDKYRRAIECDPEHGRAHHRLGLLLWKVEDDLKAALPLLREAVRREPRNVDFRMALGEAYLALDMKLNARRQFQAVLDIDRNHEDARAALKRARG